MGMIGRGMEIGDRSITVSKAVLGKQRRPSSSVFAEPRRLGKTLLQQTLTGDEGDTKGALGVIVEAEKEVILTLLAE